ncbi:MULTISPECIES: ArsR/SmtB family transcription factor [Brevibacillus]|uniref:Transcriptional regulator n=1 Tax=Brevibacillus borstelensis AK1 TaxID=1300222 RepID=M8D232_9BACL|nr:winged helix-turn-helix domain-containing protein [Brevibacillus borstelensis]EMT50274.1 transcriptional regulator [Brevibacillus borstelensis AK1]KKX52620.1 ArsR family transcriptional regulator [Brevibacillus borstelensis cifa_chp40]MBE5395672.1 winged helix-turn-helix transcriptional regulator [Brevibacillus borstelensis]MCC0565074.1 winged helix-turn-helix domain-containing protein [Brevibacillus borstelensis]MCM3471815.1 winged helix-turn-helix domain-containing protein [Brevibacillus 
MNSSPDIVEVASLIGEPSRVAILISLIGGKALPASELARIARITPQTASSHLAKLVEGGLLSQESYGRHRYYRLANPEVAHALEALQAIAVPKPVRSLRESDQMKALQYARTCYDHLAGKIGVALTDRLLELGLIQESGKDFLLSAEGKAKLQALGVEVDPPPKSRRHFARQCLDWSERRHHVAGSLGASLTKRLFELGWIERLPDGRAVRVTAAGISGLSEEFGLKL